jgi:hypothetical protein
LKETYLDVETLVAKDLLVLAEDRVGERWTEWLLRYNLVILENVGILWSSN